MPLPATHGLWVRTVYTKHIALGSEDLTPSQHVPSPRSPPTPGHSAWFRTYEPIWASEPKEKFLETFGKDDVSLLGELLGVRFFPLPARHK